MRDIDLGNLWANAPVCLLGALHTEVESRRLGRNLVDVGQLSQLSGMCETADLLVDVTKARVIYYTDEPECDDKLDALIGWNDNLPREGGKERVLAVLQEALKKLDEAEASIIVKGPIK